MKSLVFPTLAVSLLFASTFANPFLSVKYSAIEKRGAGLVRRAADFATFQKAGKDAWDTLQTGVSSGKDKQTNYYGVAALTQDDVTKQGYTVNNVGASSYSALNSIFGTLGLDTSPVKVQVTAPPTLEPAFINAYGPKVLIADENYAKKFDPIKKMTWSDIAFTTYKKVAEDGDYKLEDVAYIFRIEITNLDTKDIMDQIYAKTCKDKEQWTEFTPDYQTDDGSNPFLALLGTDNGKSSAFLLGDHSESFNKANIKSVHTHIEDDDDYFFYYELTRGEVKKPPAKRWFRSPLNRRDGESCENDGCKSNQVKDTTTQKCKDCPQETTPNKLKNTCDPSTSTATSATATGSASATKSDTTPSPTETADCPDGQAQKADKSGCETCPDGKTPNPTRTGCIDAQDPTKCPDGQAINSAKTGCETCPAGQVPKSGKDGCEDEAKDPADCPDGQKLKADKSGCETCPAHQVPTATKDGCEDDEETKKKKQQKADFEAKKQALVSGGSKGFKGGAALGLGAGIAELLKLIPSNVPWDYEGNVDVCAVTMGTHAGGGCKTRVACQVDGEKEYDAEWSVCYEGGKQFFNDDRIGAFTVTFSVGEGDRCPEGLCRPILQVENFNDWMQIDAEQEDTNYYDADNKNQGICHDGKSDLAADCSECSGKDFWWVCGVPNL